jgi:hypothetical protein
MARVLSEAERREVEELRQTFEKLYGTLRPELERLYDGQYVAIQVKTGAYFVARKRREAIALAERSLGSSDYCWSRRIGAVP